MTPRRQRLLLVGLVLGGVIVSAALALRAFRENLVYFFSPTQVSTGEAPARAFRLGGMVVEKSVQREPGSLTVRFVLTDFAHTVPVSYTGILPDLFREGQGIVAIGQMQGDTFVANEVLAKHDENYMPPEVADALAKSREAQGQAQ
jgi:cytochrome c-type biogenesis protein CcmE